jgi:hypothetical protein
MTGIVPKFRQQEITAGWEKNALGLKVCKGTTGV